MLERYRVVCFIVSSKNCENYIIILSTNKSSLIKLKINKVIKCSKNWMKKCNKNITRSPTNMVDGKMILFTLPT